jgi:enamine deaminase RidA (YjgF/YER057c/UK114 family)
MSEFEAIGRSHIFTGSVYEDMAGYARAVIVGDQIFVSGTVGVDFKTGQLADGAGAQAEQALKTIGETLHEAHSGLADVVRVVAYVPDFEDVAAVAGVLKRHFDSIRPANTTVCAPLAVPGARVELEVTAIRGSAKQD